MPRPFRRAHRTLTSRAHWALLAALVSPGLAPSQAASEMPQGPVQSTVVLPTVVIARAKGAIEEAALQTPKPTDWLPSRGRECNMKGRYKRFCQGPRRVPRPHGPAAARARRLELGTHKTVNELIGAPPRAEWVAAAGGPAEHADLSWPVPEGKFWRGFGRTRRTQVRKLHEGIDIGAPDGTPIRAAHEGIVAYSDNGIRGFGNLIVLVHPDAGVTLYAHCRATYLFPGQRVRRGQVIGEVGHTGIARGPHLHFEWHKRGRPRDPMRHFADAPERAKARARASRRRQRAARRNR